jgi:hypothetical protein
MDDWSIGTLDHWKIILTILVAAPCFAGEPVITCEPREQHGVPGQPLQVEITIETDRAVPAQLRIPHIDGLFLRTVEKIPIQRTKEGRYTQKRIVIWQGLETANLTLTNLVVSFQTLETTTENVPSLGKEKGALTQSVPSIGIIIDAVEPAKPPAKKEDE